MHEPLTLNWLSYVSPSAHSVDIKAEPSFLEPSLIFPSPPSSPSIPCSASSILPPSPLRRRSKSSIISPKRVKPYPCLPRETRFHEEAAGEMGDTSCGTWSSSVIKGGKGKLNNPGERRLSHTDQQSSCTLSHAFELHSFMAGSFDRSDHRPQSSSSIMTTSSLTGAVGDAHVLRRLRHSNSPFAKEEQSYDMTIQSGLVWASNQTPPMPVAASYTGVPEQANVPYHNLPPSASIPSPAGSYTQYYNSSTYKNPPPESFPLQSPAFSSPQYNEQLSFQQSRGLPAIPSRPDANYNIESMSVLSSPSLTHSRTASATQEMLENEIRHLRKKVRDLELTNESAWLRVSEFESQLAIDRSRPGSPSSSTEGPRPTPLAPSATFKASWKARTEARVQRFCSLNRAGNALCAWHDSRRERRTYPPRMAPNGYLNCGCTYEEALFEESLARHNVGSYHPGETVRMDPALRNPLLKLLQTRYGYRDGDFERDRNTGDWVQGEGPAYWETRAHTGAPSSRKSRGEYDRR